MNIGSRTGGTFWLVTSAMICLLTAECGGAGDPTDTTESRSFDLGEFWPPAAGRLYAIMDNRCDGNEISGSWHEDGYEYMRNRAGLDDDGAPFITALAFRVPDLQKGDTITYARLRLASAGAEMPQDLTLEIAGIVGVTGEGFSPENLPSGMAWTTARTTWRIPRPWSEGSNRLPPYYASPDISSIVNELVSQPDWERSEMIALAIAGKSPQSGRMRFVMIDDYAGSGEYHSPALLGICRDVADTFFAEPMLGRPTDHSVTAYLLSLLDIEAYAEFGTDPGSYTGATRPVQALAGNPLGIAIDGLLPDTAYYYRVMYRRQGADEFTEGSIGRFRTQRHKGAFYTFTIQADSHIIGNLRRRSSRNLRLYELTLKNVLLDKPDFHFSMGDFAHIEMYTGRRASSLQDGIERYLVQRHFLGDLARQVPFFLVLGNHEGEQGWRTTREGDSLEVWGTLARKITIPNPHPDGFYSGSTDTMDCCGQRENYYAWQWGDALFVVLDPFWHTLRMPHRGGGYVPSLDAWDWTLGREQYEWLYRTLHESDARWKFVFSHHMTGGVTGARHENHPYGRGGIDAAKFKVSNRPSFEWGGEDSTGAYVFDEKRPGWDHGPIHDMLVETGVDIFFHGHDHAFVYEELDGVVYQECPVPSGGGYDNGYVERDFYTTGRVVPNSGHMRVAVSPDSVRVDYVRAVLPEDEPLYEDEMPVRNGAISYSYVLRK